VSDRQSPERVLAPAVLIVSDDVAEAARLAAGITAERLGAIRVNSQESALNVLDQSSVDALVTRLRAPRIQGLQLLALARERNPQVEAILIIDRGDEEQATRFMRRGVADFQHRPVNVEKVVATVRRLLEHQRLAAELMRAHQRLNLRFSFAGIVGASGAIVRVLSQIQEIAPLDCPVLVTGESGTGKTLVARVLHQNSPRRQGPFVTFDCASLPPRLAAQALLGTMGDGQRGRRRGRIESANGGSLHLHQIAALSKELQARLAGVLQTKLLRPELASEPIELDVRLIASSEAGLDGLVGEEKLHEALYVILREAPITLPPLRHRRRDVPLLVHHFLEELALGGHGRVSAGRDVLDLLEAHSWPGNVRELRNTIEQIVAGLGERLRIQREDLPEDIRSPQTRGSSVMLPIGSGIEDAEKRLIVETIRMTGGNRERAAHVLGVSIRTLYRKLRSYGINRVSECARGSILSFWH
jgi:two-component system response regulator HydG